jgi:D-alanyl-D-alanine carboxypeptidase/D-alanyl-D-alanine-endopeptidase (penicillin-binding protein 4)
VELLRHIMQWVEANNLRPEDIMPVAGVDPGTLHRRFRTDQYRGTVVAKTGTLPATDGGVSTLAGILYTRDSGTVLFAIFNTRLNVNTARMLQDSLLKNVLTEFGSAPPISASSRRLNN